MEGDELRKTREAWRRRFQSEEEQRKRLAQAARRAAEDCARTLAKQFRVKRVYLFGSVKSPAGFHRKSDIDLAVEGLPSREYFPALSVLMAKIPADLEIDLVPLEDAFPELVQIVKREGELLYGEQ